jgi:hypothetical protein
MGAVDAGNVHAQRNEALYQGIVIGSLGGKGHHDPGHPARRAGTEESVSIVVEGGTALFEALDRRPETRCSSVERSADALDRGQYVRLASAK